MPKFNKVEQTEEMPVEDMPMMTSAGDPIAPNHMQAHIVEGKAENILPKLVSSINVSTDVVLNDLNTVVSSGGDIGGVDVERINQLRKELVQELNKAQQQLNK